MFERKTKYSLFSVQARFSKTVLYVVAFLWLNDFAYKITRVNKPRIFF